MGVLWLLFAAGSGAVVGLLATRISTPSVVLIAAVGLLGAAIVVKLPEIGLLAIVFATFANLSDVLVGNFGAPPTLMKLLVPLVVVAVLAQWFWSRRSPEGWLQPALLIAAYVLAGFLSLFAAVDPGRTLEGLSNLVKDGVVVVLVVILIQRGATLRRVFWTLLAAGVLMGTISVHQYFTGNFGFDYWGFGLEPATWSATGGREHRVAGPIGNPNSYGLILLLVVPIAVDRVMSRDRPALRILALWALIVCSLSIVLTFSRGAFVGLVALFAFLWLIRRPPFRHVLVAIGVAALLSPLVPASYLQRIGTLVSAIARPHETIGFQDSSLRGRLSENLAAVQMFLDHPLTGVGMGNYPVRYQDYSQRIMLDPRSTQRATHNLYLEIASETGILGLLTFGAVLWVLFHRILIARRMLGAPELVEFRNMVDAISIGLLGYLAGSVFLHAAHTRYFWLLAGVAFALPRVASNEMAALHRTPSADESSLRGGL